MLLASAQSLVGAGTCDAGHQASMLAAIPRGEQHAIGREEISGSSQAQKGRRFGSYDLLLLDAVQSAGVPLSGLPYMVQQYLDVSDSLQIVTADKLSV